MEPYVLLFAAVRELERRLPPVEAQPPEAVAADEFLDRMEQYRSLVVKHRPDVAEELDRLAEGLRQAPGEARRELAGRILRHDIEGLYALATDLGLAPQHLHFLGELAVRPYLTAWARAQTQSGAVDLLRYQGNRCPVCDRVPHMGHIDSDNIKWLHCPACETIWRYARVGCVHCGSLDSEQSGFFTLEDDEEHRVEYCLDCGGYLKVIDQRVRGRQVDYLLEDAATLHLDELAAAEGYRREN